MKKLILPLLFALIVLAQPFDLFAKTICFSDEFNNTFYLSGGKFDQKPFSGNALVAGGSCNVPIWGAIIFDSVGTTKVAINGAHTACSTSFWVSTSGTLLFSSGHYDNGQEGTADGAMSLTQINCDSIPPAVTTGSDKGPGAKSKE